MAKRSDAMRKWALIGAEQRLVQLAAEITAIHNAFPELRQGRKRASVSTGDAIAGAAPKRRRRRKMSAEARKRISDAQKARWAKQKGEKKR
jgi:hypothetical protein